MLQNVKIIRAKLDLPMLRAMDRVARQARVNRSGLIRTAVREHLKRLVTLELEARDRSGYRAHPDDPEELADWERVAEAWQLE